MSNGAWRWALVGLVGLTVACTPGKPARDAIAAAEAALAVAPADARTLIPQQHQAVTNLIAAAKAAVERGDYKTARVNATDAATTIEGFPAAIEKARTDLAARWKVLSDSLPGMVSAVERRLNELSRAGRLPSGVTRANVDAAKATLAEVKTTWTEAQTAAAAGDVVTAVTKGRTCRTRTTEMMAALGMRRS